MRNYRQRQTTAEWNRLTFPGTPGRQVSMRADVCVVGAGIAGDHRISARTEGKSVIVLDEGEIGSGQTGRTAHILTAAIDDRFFQMKSVWHRRRAGAVRATLRRSVWFEKISRDEQIDCEFAQMSGITSTAPGCDAMSRSGTSSRARGVCGRGEDIRRRLFCSDQTSAALRFPNQAQLHPAEYLFGLSPS